MTSINSRERCLQLLLLAIASACLVGVFVPTSLLAQEVPQVGNVGATGIVSTPTGSNMLSWIVRVSGIIGVFIFLLSVYFGAIVIKSLLELRLRVAAPLELVGTCEKLIADRNPRELITTLQADDSYFSQILLAGILELKYGLEEGREKLERKAESLTGQMERGISILAVLGTLGPMIGLLGTLKGMIASFSVIAISGVALDAAKVAEGISEALVLTFEGVALSVPAIYFYSFFRNRISMISLEASLIADDLLRSTSRLLKLKPNPSNE